MPIAFLWYLWYDRYNKYYGGGNLGVQRVNIDVEKWLWKQVGIAAIKEGMTKRELVENALLAYTYKIIKSEESEEE